MEAALRGPDGNFNHVNGCTSMLSLVEIDSTYQLRVDMVLSFACQIFSFFSCNLPFWNGSSAMCVLRMMRYFIKLFNQLHLQA